MPCELAFALAMTAHLGLVGDYNSVHPSARCDFDNGVTVGAYYNSERRVSAFLGYRWEGQRFWAEAGLVTGYSDAPVVPFGRVGVKINDRVSVFVAPAYEVWDGHEHIGAVIGTEVRF
jgi:hypothetical protein